MRALIQRVERAGVVVAGQNVGAVGSGLLVLAAVKHGDTDEDCDWIAGKIADLRIFGDEAGKMNLSVAETGGSVLLVSQFTLYGDVRKGRRPSFTGSAPPDMAVPMLDRLKARIEAAGVPVETGEFGAHMKVELLNDGPVTLMLDSEDRRGAGGEDSSDSVDRAFVDTADTGAMKSDRFRLLRDGSPLRTVPIVLASSSPRRRDLLRDLGLPFSVQEPEVDESVGPGTQPEVQAREVAVRKARAVGARMRECVIIAADTIVTRDGQVFGKPGDRVEAIDMLTHLSDGEHRVVTGVCVAHPASDLWFTRIVITVVRFRNVGEAEIRRYVDTGEPFGKAGAYAIQELGGLLVSGIRGDYSNVVGLPLGATLDLLDELIGAGVGGGSAGGSQ